MKAYMEKMDETYRNKNYPQGSFFEKAAKENRRGNMILAVMAGIVSAALAALLLWMVSLVQYHSGQGNDESVKVGLIFMAVVAAVLALCLFGLVMAVRHIRDGVGDVLKKASKNCGLTEEELREFDSQAMQSDSYVLSLTGKLSAAMAGQKDGILTRDYIWLGDTRSIVLKRQDIVGASLYHWYYYVNKKRVRSLNLALLNKNDVMATAEVKEEAGRELMDLLARENPAVQLHQGILEEGKEFDAWREEHSKAKG